MFRRELSIPLRDSAAALSNNLSVLQLPAGNLKQFAVVHGTSAQLLSAAPEDGSLVQRQLHAKEGPGVSPSLITQVRHGAWWTPARLAVRSLPALRDTQAFWVLVLSCAFSVPPPCRSTGVSSLSESCWFSPPSGESR